MQHCGILKIFLKAALRKPALTAAKRRERRKERKNGGKWNTKHERQGKRMGIVHPL